MLGCRLLVVVAVSGAVLWSVGVEAGDAVYEVGKYRVGRNCGNFEDHRFPNSRRVSIPFLNENFGGEKLPVVVAIAQRPYERTGYMFGVNIVMVDHRGFMAEVRRLDTGELGPMQEFLPIATGAHPVAEKMVNVLQNDIQIPAPQVMVEGIHKVSEGWCFDEVDIHWMAYAPGVVKTEHTNGQ